MAIKTAAWCSSEHLQKNNKFFTSSICWCQLWLYDVESHNFNRIFQMAAISECVLLKYVNAWFWQFIWFWTFLNPLLINVLPCSPHSQNKLPKQIERVNGLSSTKRVAFIWHALISLPPRKRLTWLAHDIPKIPRDNGSKSQWKNDTSYSLFLFVFYDTPRTSWTVTVTITKICKFLWQTL